MAIKAVLFDLDGVITDTAKYHFESWQYVAKDFGIKLEPEFEEELKGIDRINSLKKILKLNNISISEAEFQKTVDKKNKYYLSLLDDMTEDNILPGILKLLKQLKANNLKIIIASISQNAPYIINKLGINDYIDAIANPKEVASPKPAPDIFIKAMHLANCSEDECVGVEDAIAGVAAINSANIFSIGIGNDLLEADLILSNTDELTFDVIMNSVKN